MRCEFELGRLGFDLLLPPFRVLPGGAVAGLSFGLPLAALFGQGGPLALQGVAFGRQGGALRFELGRLADQRFMLLVEAASSFLVLCLPLLALLPQHVPLCFEFGQLGGELLALAR